MKVRLATNPQLHPSVAHICVLDSNTRMSEKEITLDEFNRIYLESTFIKVLSFDEELKKLDRIRDFEDLDCLLPTDYEGLATEV